MLKCLLEVLKLGQMKTQKTQHKKTFLSICTHFTFQKCLSIPDAPVHPPVSKTHPYDNQDPKNMPADTGYGCQMVDGVVHVYNKKTNMDKYVVDLVGS